MVAALFTLQDCAGLSETHRLCSVKVRDVLVLPSPTHPTRASQSPHTCVPVHRCSPWGFCKPYAIGGLVPLPSPAFLCSHKTPIKDPKFCTLTLLPSATQQWFQNPRAAGILPISCLSQCYVDGPYGTPTRQIFTSEHAVLIGAGIGITPFASILQSIMYRLVPWQQLRLSSKVVLGGTRHDVRHG